jgi:thiamine-phosphate diphosphorylase
VDIVQAAIRGGASAIQLRDKQTNTRDTLALGRELRALTLENHVLFIVNDRIDLAIALEADGVHLGQDDLPIAIARRMVGPNMIIGTSANTEEEARRAEGEGVDYLGVGPAYPTTTRDNPRPVLGPEGIARIRRACTLPMAAIGGITAERAGELRQTGVNGICVVAAIFGAMDPDRAARELSAAWNGDLAEAIGPVTAPTSHR